MNTPHLCIVPKTHAASSNPFEPSPSDHDRLAKIAGNAAMEGKSLLECVVVAARLAEHEGYLRGMRDCERIDTIARGVLETPPSIPDDPARTFLPDDPLPWEEQEDEDDFPPEADEENLP